MKNYLDVVSKLSIILLSLTSLPAYAGKNNCPSDIVHCAYVSGLSNDLNDGRYIKLHNNKIGDIVICFDGTSAAFLEQQAAGKFQGLNTDVYSICADKQGERCEPVGIDTFTVSMKQGKFVADPVYFKLDLSKLKNNYQPCVSIK